MSKNLKHILIEFLNDNYYILIPEIYSYFNKLPIILFVHKKDHYYNNNIEKIKNYNHLDFLEDDFQTNNWTKFDKTKHISFFVNEFEMKGNKYKKVDVKFTFEEIFKNLEIGKKLELPKNIKKILSESRSKCSNIRVIKNEKERLFQSFEIGERIYFNLYDSSFSNPGIVLDNKLDDKLKILYFTNIDTNNLETNKKDFNCWSIRIVNNIDVGKNPTEAKLNSFL